MVSTSTAVAAIDSDSVNGEVRENNVSNAVFGVFDTASAVGLASNTIIGTTYGIFLGNGGTAVGNEVSGSMIGILLGASGATLSGNRIVSSTSAGVELGCFAANDAAIGFVAAPAGSIGSNNNLSNTATTITDGRAVAACGPAKHASGQFAGAVAHPSDAFRHTHEVRARECGG